MSIAAEGARLGGVRGEYTQLTQIAHACACLRLLAAGCLPVPALVNPGAGLSASVDEESVESSGDAFLDIAAASASAPSLLLLLLPASALLVRAR
eukprot:3487005-Rhodomonas_salina.2